MNAASAAAALASCAASRMPRLRLPCLIPATSGKASAAARNSGTHPGYLRTVAAQPPLNHAGQPAWRPGFLPGHGARPSDLAVRQSDRLGELRKRYLRPLPPHAARTTSHHV